MSAVLQPVEPDPESQPRPAADASASRLRLALPAILLVALAARLLYLQQFAALPFFDHPVGDSAAHLKRAAEIAHGQLLPSRPFYYCSIFYPYFLATMRLAFGSALLPVALVQLVAGTAVIGLLAAVVRRAFGTAAALATAACAALYGPSAFFEADVLGVVWGQLALVLGMLVALAWWRDGARRARIAALAGIALGLAAVERPNLLAIVPLLGAWIVWLATPRTRWKSACALLAGVIAPLAIVLALNVAGTGQWVPLTTSGGINLALGYHDGATGTYDEPWERVAPEFSARHREPEDAMTAWASERTGRPLTARQASSWWARTTLHWIAAHPRDALLLTVRKALLLLNDTEVPNHLDYGFIRERAWALWLMPLGFGLLLPIAALGAWTALRRRTTRPAASLFLLVACGACAGVVPFTVADRYRAPMVPPLLALAGLGIVALPALAADSRRRWAPALLAGAALAIAFVPLVRPMGGRNHWMMAAAWQTRGNLPAAVAEWESAVRAEPNDAALLNQLAIAYKMAGRRDDEIAALRRAIAVQPTLVLPHRNLAMALIVAGDRDGALAELREAVRLEPGDARTQGALGALLAERGDVDGAVVAFAEGLRLAPDDALLRGLLAHYPAVASRLRSR